MRIDSKILPSKKKTLSVASIVTLSAATRRSLVSKASLIQVFKFCSKRNERRLFFLFFYPYIFYVKTIYKERL